jgi:PAS domain S-box-containing protein
MTWYEKAEPLDNELRRRAEEIAENNPEQLSETYGKMSPLENRKLLHELSVQHIELELQNDELRRSYAELEAAKSRYDELYHQAPVGYCTISEKGLILEINCTGARMLGMVRRELLTLPLSQFIHPEDQDLSHHSFTAIFSSGEKQVLELRMVTGDGAMFWARLESTVAQLEVNVSMCMVVIIDITADKLKDEALLKSYELNSTLLKSLPFPFDIVDQQGRILYMNDQLTRLVGKNTLGDVCWEHYKDDGQQCADCPLHQPIQIGKTVSVECDGILGKKSVQAIHTGIIFENQEAVIEIFIDITERKQIEEELKTSDRRFVATFQQAAVGIAHVGLDGSWLRVNTKLCQIVGYHWKELIEKTFQDITHPDDLEIDLANIQQLLTGSIKSYALEKRYYRKDRTLVWVNLTVSLVHKLSGEPDYFISVIEDIDDRKHQEEALRESEEIFECFMENSPIYIFFKDQNLQVLRLSKNYELLPGRALKERLGQTTHEDFPPAVAQKLLSDELKILREGKAVSIDEQIGERFYTTIKFPIYIDGQPRYLAGYTLDITEPKLAEAERELLMAAFEQSGESIVITDLEGNIQYVNRTFEVETGYSRKEVQGQHTRILQSGRHNKEFYQQLWDTISSGNTFMGRMVNRHKDGSLYTEDVTISPVVNVSGDIIRYVAVKRNVTEHIQLEEQFYQAQKMESIGRLAGGVAHDYNNMLSVILGFTELAMCKLQDADPIKDDLQEVTNAALTSAEITRQLLAFARQQPVNPKVVDLNEALEGMLKMLRRLIGEDVNLLWMPSGEKCLARIDPSQIDQIMVNLCVNARDAITGTGSLTIKVRIVTLDETYCDDHLGSVPGEYVKVSVADSGSGMEEEVRQKIFEPFYTTKELGKGTGLGLATVYGIVKQNNGYIDVMSQRGEGTEFTIFLPQQHDDMLGEQQKQSRSPRGGGQTILIVEDEISILRLTQKILEELGYRVLVASTPEKAVSVVKEHGNSIDVVVTDVIMPGMDGRALSELLSSFKPGLKFVFMSGYSSDILAASGIQRETVSYIQKPFSSDELARVVAKVLQDDQSW